MAALAREVVGTDRPPLAEQPPNERNKGVERPKERKKERKVRRKETEQEMHPLTRVMAPLKDCRRDSAEQWQRGGGEGCAGRRSMRDKQETSSGHGWQSLILALLLPVEQSYLLAGRNGLRTRRGPGGGDL
jgi:hypothetical protein